MVVAQSPTSHQAAADALPMRDAFAVLFFVAVGMLFTPMFLFEQPLMILAALGIILIAKPLAALAIVALLGHSGRTALTVALGLAQIGEFSFILSDLARKEGLMPHEGHSVLVAAAIISITINPLLYRRLVSIENFLKRRPWLWALLNGRAERRAQLANVEATERLNQQLQAPQRLAIVVGFGPVGRFVHRLLREGGMTTVVIDMNIDAVSELRSQGLPAIFGDASQRTILEQAGMGRASNLIVALPHTAPRNAVVTAARNLNPRASVFVRAHYLRERRDLEQAGATAAVFEEAEAAVALARLVLTGTGTHRDVVERRIRDLRMRLIMENVSSARSRTVRSIMVPWIRVRRLNTTDTREEVLQQVAQHRFSRWPVTEPGTGKVAGYLLAKDLLAERSADRDWPALVRPLRAVRPDDDVESTLAKLQSENATVAIVDDGGSPVGLVTLEDILEQVVGLIEDEYPREPSLTLADAVTAGGVLLSLKATTANESIEELADAITPDRLPPCGGVAELAIEREQEVPTDLGVGVAVPHARCPDLKGALVVFGRSVDGVQFSGTSPEPVRLIFLLVTPLDEPDLQLALLAQIARVAGDAALRERLLAATTQADVIDAIAEEQQAQEAARSE
jgi:mannitol/fructose-specific phosphotransferase system IIA component (Ntr-type)/voltage-gated potassium channel Kch